MTPMIVTCRPLIGTWRPTTPGSPPNRFCQTLVAEERDGRRVQVIFLGAELPPENRLHAEEREGLGGDVRAEKTLGLFAVGDDEGGVLPRAEAFQRGRLLPDLEEIGKRQAVVVLGALLEVLREVDEALLVLDERERPEQNRIDDREAGRAGSNAERDGENGDDREAPAS